MTFKRLIGRLDIKGPNVIKGIRLEGSRVIGSPDELAKKYYDEGIDELIYNDTVASLYGRNNLHEIVSRAASELFIPLTVCGGVRSVEDVQKLLNSGADKVAVNTAATKNPSLISMISGRFGSQCMVLSIEAKRQEDKKWEALTDNGREHTGMDVVEWAKKGEELGAGEIFLTSVDNDGVMKGYDIDLIKEVSDSVSIPVIACGGLGCEKDLCNVFTDGCADAAAGGAAFHFNKLRVSGLKRVGIKMGLNLRNE